MDFLEKHFARPDATERAEVSLVTCEPYDKVYSLYGHTGLRIHDPVEGVDILANWGIFDLSMKFFAVRFALGLTDYKMDIEEWDYFRYRYAVNGCGIYEQTLNLTKQEKRRLIALVLDNYKPENRCYRYNFLYDNCTTRVRDIIEASVSGTVCYPENREKRSYRALIHEWNGTHLWARWGNDFLMGVKADKKAGTKEAQFLPFNLSGDFDAAVIKKDSAGKGRKLVGESRWAVPATYKTGANSFIDEFVLSPTGAVMAYVVLFVAVWAIEIRYKKRIWQFDAAVLTITGLMGLLLLVMPFSQHPTVRLNAQILVYNPLSLLFLRRITTKLRRGEHSRYLSALAIMAGIGIVLGIMAQHFAEGTMTLALFLIITYMRSVAFKKNESR